MKKLYLIISLIIIINICSCTNTKNGDADISGYPIYDVKLQTEPPVTNKLVLPSGLQ